MVITTEPRAGVIVDVLEILLDVVSFLLLVEEAEMALAVALAFLLPVADSESEGTTTSAVSPNCVESASSVPGKGFIVVV